MFYRSFKTYLANPYQAFVDLFTDVCGIAFRIGGPFGRDSLRLKLGVLQSDVRIRSESEAIIKSPEQSYCYYFAFFTDVA
jgi:hypothetical protein